MSLTTDENATCRYAITAGVVYAAMPNFFTTTGATAHSTSVAGLVNGGSYNYYVRCQDTAGNPDTTDFPITFTVAQQTTAPSFVQVNHNQISSGTSTSVAFRRSDRGGEYDCGVCDLEQYRQCRRDGFPRQYICQRRRSGKLGNGYSAQIFYATNRLREARTQLQRRFGHP